MRDLKRKVDGFLAGQRIAVAGVSRAGDQPANLIHRKLRGAGYEVFPINPRTEEVEGERCYRSLREVPAPVDGLVICTPPDEAEGLVRECIELAVPRVWMHRSFGTGSVSQRATELAESEGLSVIAGACPMMFVPPVDFGHRCIRFMARLTGGLPG